MGNVQTMWNGEPCVAKTCIVIVMDSGKFQKYWAKHIVGKEVAAVEIDYGNKCEYIYDEDGSGWDKITTGFGSSSISHKSLEISTVVRYL